MKYLLASVFILFFLKSPAQLKLFRKDISEMVINQKEATIKVHVLNKNFNLKPDNRLIYYWYKSNDIKETQGGYEGKLLHGKFTCFYLNSNLKEKGKFRNGLKHGEWKAWYPGGRLKEIANYNNGVKHGTSITFSENGEMTLEEHYRKGVLHGHYIVYENGMEKEKKEFRNGKEVISTEKSKTGEPKNKITPVEPVEEKPPVEKPQKKKKKAGKDDGSSKA
ncbi:MAG: hypothetical protein HYY40_11830 [Bacteroidetes bacterium]|nr:hypothetical protein [Bacteroidota bacterium]